MARRTRILVNLTDRSNHATQAVRRMERDSRSNGHAGRGEERALVAVAWPFPRTLRAYGLYRVNGNLG